MEKEKLYFKDEDSTHCYSLQQHLEGIEPNEKEITLIEAIPDNETTDYIWCTAHGEVSERSECKKSECSLYSSKSGRGVCVNRGKLYLHGEEVTFKTQLKCKQNSKT